MKSRDEHTVSDTEFDVPIEPLTTVDILEKTSGVRQDWKNFVLAEINDHVVRVSVLERDFHWHRHTNSDEAFLVLDGELLIDLEDRTETLSPGQTIVIPKNVLHRTRAAGRVVSLTFEHRDTDVYGDQPPSFDDAASNPEPSRR